MDRDQSVGTHSRRDLIRYGGIASAGLLAGCAGNADTESGTTTASGTTTTTTQPQTTEQPTTTDESYSVSMAPMGDVTFEAVPERWIAYDGGYADMAVALGRADGITGIGNPDRYYTHFYDELPGVRVDRDTIESNALLDADMSKEVFYALENDVHLMDPRMLVNWFGWSAGDVQEITENVAPFLGNLIFRREDDWHDYRYFTLYQAFERVADLFQASERYEAFASLHESFLARVQARMPSADARPNVLLVFAGSDEPTAFSPYRLNDKGTSKKQWRDLGVSDALAGTGIDGLSTTDRGKIDYETMLEVDPDVILVRGHERQSADEFRDTVLAFMQEHPAASKLTAVENERVYRGGALYQGPIQNLFLTERGAKQLFPDEFGAVTDDTQLFDRQRVADIVAGDL